MPRLSNQKFKALYITRILLERTDERNVLTAQEICDVLLTYDIPASRQSIYDDIEVIRKFGLDVVLQPGKGGGYFIATRDFELPELKLLVDAVQSSRLITGKKCHELIGKLSKLASREQAKQLNRQVWITGRAKALNETVYYNIDAIHEAINTVKKIKFKYFDYNIKKKRAYRKKDQFYINTPVAMCWNDDKYYLITYNPYFVNAFAPYRVDRMASVEVLDESADSFYHKKFSIVDYIKQTFGMYSGEIIKARLAFDESLVNVVLDHFGSDTHLLEIGSGRFAINVEVSNSPVFLGWIFQLGDKAEILEPESLRTAMREMISTVSSTYGE